MGSAAKARKTFDIMARVRIVYRVCSDDAHGSGTRLDFVGCVDGARVMGRQPADASCKAFRYMRAAASPTHAPNEVT